MDLAGVFLLFAACGVVVAAAWFVAEIAWWMMRGDDD
jgi:hypothetical protein